MARTAETNEYTTNVYNALSSLGIFESLEVKGNTLYFQIPGIEGRSKAMINPIKGKVQRASKWSALECIVNVMQFIRSTGSPSSSQYNKFQKEQKEKNAEDKNFDMPNTQAVINTLGTWPARGILVNMLNPENDMNILTAENADENAQKALVDKVMATQKALDAE